LLRMTRVMCAVALCSGAWLGPVTPIQAATVTDTFEVTLTGTQWCDGSPKFGEKFIVKVDPKHPTINTTLTLTREDSTSTAIQATLNTQGGSPDLDAIILKGQAFPTTKTGLITQLVLAGTKSKSPRSLPDHPRASHVR